MKYFSKSLFVFFILVFSTTESKTQTVQIFEDWSKVTGYQDFLYKNSTKTDAQGNIYTVGSTINSAGDYDILVHKYDYKGNELWMDTVAGAGEGDDLAMDLEIDTFGYIVVCGSIFNNDSTGNDGFLIKYSHLGVEQWRESFDLATNDDGFANLTLDSNDDIYVTGGTYTRLLSLTI